MIKIRYAKKESCDRDKKRERLVLIIGKKKYHITQEEGYKLYKDLGSRLYLRKLYLRR